MRPVTTVDEALDRLEEEADRERELGNEEAANWLEYAKSVINGEYRPDILE